MKVERETQSLRICTNCVLPETFPGIRFDSSGICNFCLDFQNAEKPEIKRAEYRQRFEALVEEHKGKNVYDVLMCYSGGKDSTYTLYILKETYGLNILAVSFDNGFLSDRAFLNIRTVAEKLNVDHIFYKPRFDVLAKIFSHCATINIYSAKAMERASSICTSCMGIVKYCALRLAVEKDIPFVAYGWSPGQTPISSSVMKNNPLMVKKMQEPFYKPLYKIAGDSIKPFFLEDKHFTGHYRFPYYIHPLAFLDYTEETVYRTISQLGWKAPEDVDANSTNCLLNSYANVVHKKQYGFHPYAFELANLVREGYMSRTIALDRLNTLEDPDMVEMIKKKIAISGNLRNSR